MNGKLPYWKLIRELQRVLWQIAGPLLWVSSFLIHYFGAAYYGVFKSRGVRRHNKAVPLGKKAAIYLISPTNGLEETHLHSLEYIVSKGYSPIVVSNQPISDADRQRLIGHCTAYIERPNIGCDFGGYREALLFLQPSLSRLKRLAILNDSCWFPVPGGGDWIAQAEALGKDYVGAASNYGFRRVEASDYQTIKWDYSTSHADFHYCSFALMVSPRIFRSPEFMEFWRTFPKTNDTTRTVRRGEIGLSEWVIRHGYTHGATCEIFDLDRDLDRMTDARLRWVVENLVIPADPNLSRIKTEVLEAKAPSRSDLIGLILTAVARQGSSYSLSHYTINECQFSFLKKSPVYLEEDASNVTLRIACGFDGPEGEAILKEAIALRNTRAPHFMPALCLGSITGQTPDRSDLKPPLGQGLVAETTDLLSSELP